MAVKKGKEMKKFILKLLLVGVLVLVTVGLYYVVQYYRGEDGEPPFGPELYYALDLAEERNEYTGVIIGDSVARLIFAPSYQEETSETCYLATNQAITVLGNYILLSRYLENNPQTEEVIYIVRPQSLANPLWYNFSFQYFVVPFYNETYKGYIDEDTRSYIEERFGKIYATNDIIKSFIVNSSYYMDVYLNNILEQQLEVRDEKHLSALSIKYLPMMKSLCEQYGATFTVLAAPLPDTEENHDWTEFGRQIEENGLTDILGSYLQGIEYYDESCFSDEAHFTEEFLSKNRPEIVDRLLGGRE